MRSPFRMYFSTGSCGSYHLGSRHLSSNFLFLVYSDGTGVAYYSNTPSEFGEASCSLPSLYKTVIPPANDVNFRSLCRNTASRTVFAHVRMATSEVQQFNSHPFVFGRHTFMHNGAITSFTAIRRALCDKLSAKAYGNIYGSTDSEHIAALYFTHLGEDWDAEYSLQDMKRALERAVKDVIELQKALSDATQPLTPSNLNLCTTDGNKLLAFRFRNSEEEQPPSLYYSTQAGVTLNRKYPGHPDHVPDKPIPEDAVGLKGGSMRAAESHGNHVIVASEPTTHDDKEWELVPKNQAVMVGFEGGQTSLKLEDIAI